MTGEPSSHDQSVSTSCNQSPSPSRKQSFRRTPGLGPLHTPQLQKDGCSSPMLLEGGQQQFPWLFFRDDHTPHTVILQYHPECLDNHDYFIGRKAVSLFFPSYNVSVIQYTPGNEIKRVINKKFTEIFPHVRLSQTKLRRCVILYTYRLYCKLLFLYSIKREMIRIGLEVRCQL